MKAHQETGVGTGAKVGRGARTLALLLGSVLVASVALSDEPFVTEAEQTAWVLAAGGQALDGGRIRGTCTLGEAFATDPITSSSYTLHPGFQAKKKLFPPPTTAVQPAGAPIAVSRLVGNFPNPFNPATRVRFELAAPSRVQLGIYDTTGRRVRSLLDEPMAAGAHEVSWDGRNAAGQQAASGVYFLALELPGSGFAEHHKVVLAR